MTSDGTEFLNAYDTQIGEDGTTELLVPIQMMKLIMSTLMLTP